MIALIVLGSAVVLAAAYLVYGRFLARRLQLDGAKPTPAVTVNDGQDYVPASAGLLSAVLGLILLVLSLFLLGETVRVLRRGRANGEKHEYRS